MGFPLSPSTGDEYTAPSGAVYVYTSYGTWAMAEGLAFDFGALTNDEITDIREALKTVDGAASGLDADLLDGQSSAYYTDIATRLGYTPFNAAHLPATTRMVFQQTTPPTGWTKVTDAAYNDAAFRLVTGAAGTGGSTAFTTVMAARTIAQANLPNVTLGLTMDAVPGHYHFVLVDATGDSTAPSASNSIPKNSSGTGDDYTLRGNAGTPTLGKTSTDGGHTPTGNTASINGGVSQTTMDFAVKYADFCLATKD